MFNIIKASLFKLFRDRTFHVTAIIGFVLAFLMIGVNALIGMSNGQRFFLTAITPGNSFGLTIPINLIVFTVGEFTYGTVRNKIIAGLSKAKIFLGLFVTGLVFTFILTAGYSLLVIGVSSIIGGFDADAIGGMNFILCYIAYMICAYIFITAVSVFFATLVRNIGGSNTIVIILLVFLTLLPLITFVGKNDLLTVEHWSMWINPLFMAGFYGNDIVSIIAGSGSALPYFEQSTSMILAGILIPLAWSTVFVVSGLFIFKHTDVK